MAFSFALESRICFISRMVNQSCYNVNKIIIVTAFLFSSPVYPMPPLDALAMMEGHSRPPYHLSRWCVGEGAWIDVAQNFSAMNHGRVWQDIEIDRLYARQVADCFWQLQGQRLGTNDTIGNRWICWRIGHKGWARCHGVYPVGIIEERDRFLNLVTLSDTNKKK